MKVTQLYCVRHLPTATCSLVGVALLAIGANAALDLHASEAAKVVSTQERASALQLALIIGNGNYPDAAEPLNQPINDASGLAHAMRRHGFDVDVVEDATKADMARAVERLKSRIKPGSVVMLFFGGYGVQSRHETYMIPTDAVIWKEGDVCHEGMSVETVLHAIKERGARATLAVIDASRRNPYERRFRSYSHGLAPVNAPNKRSSSRLIRLARSPMTRRASTVCSLLSCSTSSMRMLALKASSTRPVSPSFAPPMARRCRRYPPRFWRTCTLVPAMIPI